MWLFSHSEYTYYKSLRNCIIINDWKIKWYIPGALHFLQSCSSDFTNSQAILSAGGKNNQQVSTFDLWPSHCTRLYISITSFFFSPSVWHIETACADFKPENNLTLRLRRKTWLMDGKRERGRYYRCVWKKKVGWGGVKRIGEKKLG